MGVPFAVEQLAQNNGLHIYIVNETVTTNAFSNGIEASAGRETTLLIDKKRVKKIQKPYGECTPGLTSIDAYSTAYYRLTFQIYNTYRQKDCFNTCYQANLIRNYSCYSLSFPYLKNTSVPACLSGIGLFYSLYYFSQFFIADVATQCIDCPLECDSEFYTLTTSSLAYPTKIYADMLANQTQIKNRFNNIPPTYEQLKQSIASVNINYNQLGYTQINEIQKISVTDLVTNIGGTMGLFLGLSFLSFFEIVELLVELVFLLAQYTFRLHQEVEVIAQEEASLE